MIKVFEERIYYAKGTESVFLASEFDSEIRERLLSYINEELAAIASFAEYLLTPKETKRYYKFQNQLIGLVDELHQKARGY